MIKSKESLFRYIIDRYKLIDSTPIQNKHFFFIFIQAKLFLHGLHDHGSGKKEKPQEEQPCLKMG